MPRVLKNIAKLRKQGFRHFKAKIGSNLADDRHRLAMLRDIIGTDGLLMTDANQIWGVDEAIDWMTALAEFRPFWIEEPTARDDVLGFVRISKAMGQLGIGVAAERTDSFSSYIQTNACQRGSDSLSD